MRDPHVLALYYTLETGPHLAFHDPPPVGRETESFKLHLDNGQLLVAMKDHFATEDEARQEVQQYLRSWEIATDLKDGPGAMHFQFERSEVIDHNPPPPGTGELQAQSAHIAATGFVPILKVTRRSYPDPPDSFTASPDVLTMWGRYEGFLARREPLLSMAYMCLTVLEASTGKKRRSRKAAAERYGVHPDVLDKLGELTSERGDASTARKVTPGRALQPLSDVEARWVKEVIVALIRRVGEWEANRNAQRPQVTMKDFPKLEAIRRPNKVR